MYSRSATSIRRRSTQLFSMRPVNRRSWKWAVTASASRASWPPPSSRITTSAASSGRSRWRRSRWRSRRSASIAATPCAQPLCALHDELEAAGVDVLLDDRGERPGVMFADLELIGIPHRITVGDRGLKDGAVEYQGRRDDKAHGGAGRRDRRRACARGSRTERCLPFGLSLSPHADDAPLPRWQCCCASQALAGRAGRGGACRRACRRRCIARSATIRRRSSTSPPPAEGEAWLRGNGVATRPEDSRLADAARLPDHRPIRSHARRPRSADWCSDSSSTRAISANSRSRSPTRVDTCRSCRSG